MAIDFDNTFLKGKTSDSPKEGMEAISRLISSLLLARKNYTLYPAGHTICTKSLEQFHMLLDTYLQKYGNLKLDVDKDRLMFQGETVHTGTAEEGALPFTLFRDGIRWLEFIQGLEIYELAEFMRILHKYGVLSNEPDGDIVTDLWEAKLPHLKYEIAETFFSDDGSECTDASLDMQTVREGNHDDTLRESGLKDWTPLPDPLIEQSEIMVSPEEKSEIRDMVRQEEEGDPTTYLDALLDSLLENQEQENFETIMEVLTEEFKTSLGRKDFTVPIKIMESLEYVLDNFTGEESWAILLVEDFYLAISGAQSLNPLLEVWPEIDVSQMDNVRKVLTLLRPEAIHTLARLLPLNQPPGLRQMLSDMITRLASQDFSPMVPLFKNQNEKLVEKLVPIIAGLEGDEPVQILMKLVHHTSQRVRQEALKGITGRGRSHLKSIMSLIDDKDESIRRQLLRYFSQSRDQTVEGLLLDYLEHHMPKNADSSHVIACFTALGMCGSSRCVTFLRHTLFGQGWVPGLFTSAYREGAAIALGKLGIKNAQQVLDEASKSLNPSVRHAVQKVRR